MNNSSQPEQLVIVKLLIPIGIRTRKNTGFDVLYLRILISIHLNRMDSEPPITPPTQKQKLF